MAHRRYVVANDLSASAVKDIRRNVEFNGLAPVGLPTPSEEASTAPAPTKAQLEEATLGKVRVNEGDAWCAALATRVVHAKI